MELYEITKKLAAFTEELAGLKASLAYEALQAEIAEKDAALTDPHFWDDPQAAQEFLAALQRTKKLVAGLDEASGLLNDFKVYAALQEEAGEALAECEELAARLTELFAAIRQKALLTGPYDAGNAILEIHPGAGGTEAQDWAELLFKMYCEYFAAAGLSYEVTDWQEGDVAGLKSATLLVKGDYAYGLLRSERGVHRLVRISPFDSNKRRHTSFASVSLFPVIEDQEVAINPADLKIDTYRAGGAGGQHVNKTDSAVRITHVPTGIVVTCQNERSQNQNKETAMQILQSKLYKLAEDEKQKKLTAAQGELKEISWGSQIRSYVFQPYTLVKDLRTGYEDSDVAGVMGGRLAPFIDSYLKSKFNQE